MPKTEGSRKQKVRQLFDFQGDAAAFTLGRKLKLADSSLRTWFSKWRKADVEAALVRNAKAKAKKKKVTQTVAA